MAKPRFSTVSNTGAQPVSSSEPESHLRVRVPAEDSSDRALAALYQRYRAGEISFDEATQVMKEMTLAKARERLSGEDYEVFAESLDLMPLPVAEPE